MKRRLWGVIVVVSQVASARGGIVNGDFATGTFSGWSTLVSTPALGASAVVNPVTGGHRAVLTVTPTSTATATAAIQQSFTIASPELLSLDFGSDQSLAGLATSMAGTSNVSIVISQLAGGGSFEHDWTYTLFNDPVHSASNLSIPFDTVSTYLPQGGTYLLYAQVQAADGVGSNDAFAQLTLGNVHLTTAVAPEPASALSLLLGLGIAGSCWAWRRRTRR